MKNIVIPTNVRLRLNWRQKGLVSKGSSVTERFFAICEVNEAIRAYEKGQLKELAEALVSKTFPDICLKGQGTIPAFENKKSTNIEKAMGK